LFSFSIVDMSLELCLSWFSNREEIFRSVFLLGETALLVFALLSQFYLCVWLLNIDELSICMIPFGSLNLSIFRLYYYTASARSNSSHAYLVNCDQASTLHECARSMLA
jgi:hypothetical protein